YRCTAGAATAPRLSIPASHTSGSDNNLLSYTTTLPPCSTLFPYTTLFRSSVAIGHTDSVTVTTGAASAARSTLTPTSATITADETGRAHVCTPVTSGSRIHLTTGGKTVTISKQSGTGSIGSGTENADSTHS